MDQDPSIDGSILGTFLAGGLTLLAGVGLPILLLPESNLAPIIGIFCAPPAGILGAVLGSYVERRKPTLLRASLVGALAGAILPAILVLRGRTGLLGDLVFVGIPAVIFSATGALVQGVCNRRSKADGPPRPDGRGGPAGR